MATEIERKFLVTRTDFLDKLSGTELQQGYLCRGQATVRVRLAGDNAFLTLKGKTRGISRAEYEYPIPVDEARQMLGSLCEEPTIEKTRFRVEHAGKGWEVDVFHGQNKGLVMAEIELDSPDEAFERPDWVGEEVSNDPRYFNSQLALHPFTSWPKA